MEDGWDMLNPDDWAEYERESAEIAEHVATCTKDGFCLVCQSL